MNRKKSFKNTVFFVLFGFMIIVTLFVGSTHVYVNYTNKIQTLHHNQIQILKQVKAQTQTLLDRIEHTANYIQTTLKEDKTLIKKIVNLNKNITSIIILNDKGRIESFYSNDQHNIYKGFDYSLKPYFKAISKNNPTYWSDTFFSTIDEHQSIAYSFLMKNNKIGVIFLKLEELYDFVKRYQDSNKTHLIRVFDKNAMVILHPDSYTLGSRKISAKNSSVFRDLIDIKQPLEQTKFTSLNRDITHIGMYDLVPAVQWKIVVQHNYEFVIQSLKNMLVNTALLVLFFIVLAMFLSYKVCAYLFESLDTLNENANNIVHQNYESSIKEPKYIEFDRLTKNFKLMQQEIEQREEGLKNSLKSFEMLVNSTIEAIIIHKEGLILDVNEVAVRLFKFKDKSQMIHQPFEDLAASHCKAVLRSFLSIQTEPYEMEFVKKDGSSFIALSQDRFLNLNNALLKVSTIIDISELKHKEKLLFQQSKMASMGEMIGNIAHQWRQPLSTISTAASGLKLHHEMGILKQEDLYDSLGVIVKSTQYLSKTIDDFRNFFKSNRNKENFKIEDAINSVLSLMSASFKHNGISVEFETDENITLYGTKNEFIQAVINILNNAKDAFNALEVDVKKVILIRVKKDNQTVLVSIQDSALGIDEKIMPSIFDPYFTTKHKSQGTGIGLYMTHQIIVEHFKGNISACNKMFKYKDEPLYGALFILEFNDSQK
jgi:PAS domain S-box-containing protein